VKRIVYIEDSVSVQLMVKRQLSTLAEVAAGSSLADGRRLIREGAFDLLISDVHLPDGDALEWVLELRRERSIQQFPIILVSASMDQLLRIKSFQVGVNDCFPMPTPWSVFLGAVKRMLDEPYIAEAGRNGAAVTWIEGVIENDCWLFCPELNLFLRGDEMQKLNETMTERVRREIEQGTPLPLVRRVKANQRVVKLEEPSAAAAGNPKT
jgi:DNA-binding response OmpR family regulator